MQQAPRGYAPKYLSAVVIRHARKAIEKCFTTLHSDSWDHSAVADSHRLVANLKSR